VIATPESPQGPGKPTGSSGGTWKVRPDVKVFFENISATVFSRNFYNREKSEKSERIVDTDYALLYSFSTFLGLYLRSFY